MSVASSELVSEMDGASLMGEGENDQEADNDGESVSISPLAEVPEVLVDSLEDDCAQVHQYSPMFSIAEQGFHWLLVQSHKQEVQRGL